MSAKSSRKLDKKITPEESDVSVYIAEEVSPNFPNVMWMEDDIPTVDYSVSEVVGLDEMENLSIEDKDLLTLQLILSLVSLLKYGIVPLEQRPERTTILKSSDKPYVLEYIYDDRYYYIQSKYKFLFSDTVGDFSRINLDSPDIPTDVRAKTLMGYFYIMFCFFAYNDGFMEIIGGFDAPSNLAPIFDKVMAIFRNKDGNRCDSIKKIKRKADNGKLFEALLYEIDESIVRDIVNVYEIDPDDIMVEYLD